MRACSSLFSTTQNIHLVKRVMSAAQPASESMTHLFRLHCMSIEKLLFLWPIFTLLGSDRVGSQKVCVDGTIDNIINSPVIAEGNGSLTEPQVYFQSP